METSGGARLRSFDDSKGSIRAFMQLIANDERYKNVMDGIQKNDKVENLFDGMSIYAENPNYTNILSNVYKNRIQPVFQTENFLLPKRKPIAEQMDSLQ
jgi:flagellum-specific peptidoglycan hydrolase FlgJ